MNTFRSPIPYFSHGDHKLWYFLYLKAVTSVSSWQSISVNIDWFADQSVLPCSNSLITRHRTLLTSAFKSDLLLYRLAVISCVHRRQITKVSRDKSPTLIDSELSPLSVSHHLSRAHTRACTSSAIKWPVSPQSLPLIFLSRKIYQGPDWYPCSLQADTDKFLDRILKSRYRSISSTYIHTFGTPKYTYSPDIQTKFLATPPLSSDDLDIGQVVELDRRSQWDVDTSTVTANFECDELPSVGVPVPTVSLLGVQSEPVIATATVVFADEDLEWSWRFVLNVDSRHLCTKSKIWNGKRRSSSSGNP